MNHINFHQFRSNCSRRLARWSECRDPWQLQSEQTFLPSSMANAKASCTRTSTKKTKKRKKIFEGPSASLLRPKAVFSLHLMRMPARTALQLRPELLCSPLQKKIQSFASKALHLFACHGPSQEASRQLGAARRGHTCDVAREQISGALCRTLEIRLALHGAIILPSLAFGARKLQTPSFESSSTPSHSPEAKSVDPMNRTVPRSTCQRSFT